MKEEKNDDCAIINGVNISRLPTRDAYSFGLQLLDLLFTKEELGASLLFKSKKSPKPALDQARVNKLLNCIEDRYGSNDWTIKELTRKVNQKCRDSIPSEDSKPKDPAGIGGEENHEK